MAVSARPVVSRSRSPWSSLPMPLGTSALSPAQATVALYADKAQWKRIQANGMAADFSWKVSGKAYAALYRRLTGSK